MNSLLFLKNPGTGVRITLIVLCALLVLSCSSFNKIVATVDP